MHALSCFGWLCYDWQLWFVGEWLWRFSQTHTSFSFVPSNSNVNYFYYVQCFELHFLHSGMQKHLNSVLRFGLLEDVIGGNKDMTQMCCGGRDGRSLCVFLFLIFLLLLCYKLSHFPLSLCNPHPFVWSFDFGIMSLLSNYRVTVRWAVISFIACLIWSLCLSGCGVTGVFNQGFPPPFDYLFDTEYLLYFLFCKIHWAATWPMWQLALHIQQR